MYESIQKSADFIRKKIDFIPEIGIVLGTGLGGLVTAIEKAGELAYSEIPDFPVSTVEGHSGKLIFGKLAGKKVVAMQGRFHYYEGYNMQQVVFPIRVMKELGIERLILSNAAGGTNADFNIGEIMIIRDHINLFPSNPLIGKNDERWGTRFPDMSEAYDKNMIQQAKEIAANLNIRIKEGVYAGLSGPCFETPSEYKYIQIIGADAVGMSTVPEVIAARHMGIPCFAFSIITDLGVDGKITEVTHEEVQQVAREAEPKMTSILKEMLLRL